jgi:hypothetical protein
MTSEPEFDALALVRTLLEHDVDFVVIGGFAVQFHGHHRTTMDLDVVPNPDRENIERLSRALSELGAEPAEPTVGEGKLATADPERLALAAIVPPLVTRHGRIHVLKEPKGARPYARLRSDAREAEVGGLQIPVASLDDLIRMKRASARRVDLEDIAALTALKRKG